MGLHACLPPQGRACPLEQGRHFSSCLCTCSKLWKRSILKTCEIHPIVCLISFTLETSSNCQSLQLANVWSAENLFLPCPTSHMRAGIHTCVIHRGACQYSAAIQFRFNWNGSFDAQSSCSAEINREMLGPCNHSGVYNLLQSNSANRILTRTSSVVNA